MLRWLLYWLLQQCVALLVVIMRVSFRLTGGRLFFGLRLYGREHLRGLRRPVILIPNHKTFADHLYIAASLFMDVRFMPMRTMTADWIYRVSFWKAGFLLRWLMHILGAFREAKGFGLRTAFRTIQKGQSVAIYPEGIVWREAGITEVKNGAAWLARTSGALLLPCALRGLEHSNPKEFFFGRRRVSVVFGPPFRIGPSESLDAASQKIKQKLEELYYKNVPQ